MDTATSRQEAQTIRILAHLEEGNTINPLEALELYGCFRLGARIYDLKKNGHHISSKMVNKGATRIAQYTLEA